MKLPWYSLFIALLALLFSIPLRAEKLDLDSYLQQVREKNFAYQGATLKKSGAEKRTNEASLLTSPTLFSNLSWRSDAKLPSLPLFSYEKLDTQSYSLGVSQLTSFGMQAKLAYEIDYISYVNSTLAATASAQGFPLSFYDARPVLELSQPLWQNGFGASVAATQSLLREQATAEKFAAQAEAEMLVVQAEATYWRLALAKEVVEIQTAALKHAKAIYDYVFDKDKRNLGDKADTLQAKALFEARKLELKAAEDEYRVALKLFNSMRNSPLGEDPGELQPIEWEKLETKPAPSQFGMRSDVKAAEAQSKAASANAQLMAEKNKPALDLVGSVALNGRNSNLGTALGNSYDANRPTYAVGVRFMMPLELGSLSDSRQGAIEMEKAAELSYRQKLNDQRASFEDLSTRIENAKERLSLARDLEETQKNKIDYERTRLRQGRTTTYQILMFEQDYLQAELARAKTAGELLSLFAQIRLYEGEGK